LVNQCGQVLTLAEAVLVAEVTSEAAVVLAALLAAALAPRQPFTVAVCEQRPLSKVRTSPAGVLTAQLPRLDPIITALE